MISVVTLATSEFDGDKMKTSFWLHQELRESNCSSISYKVLHLDTESTTEAKILNKDSL